MSVREPPADTGDSNFGFLVKHEPLFFQLGSSAEPLFAFDSNASLLKPRQLGKAMAFDRCAFDDFLRSHGGYLRRCGYGRDSRGRRQSARQPTNLETQ